MTENLNEKTVKLINEIANVWTTGLREQLKVPDHYVYVPRTVFSLEMYEKFFDEIGFDNVIKVSMSFKDNGDVSFEGFIDKATLEKYREKK